MRSLIALKTDQRGNVLMLTGLAILILFAVAGAGVDFGRQQLVRMKLQNASDAAAIAAASLPESTSAEQRRAVALRYYNLNFPSTYLGVVRPTPNIQVGGQIIVDASTSFETNFVSNVDVNRLEAQGRTVVDRATQAASIYDVILVMDNSGSMGFETTAPNFAMLNSSEERNTRNIFELICRQQETDYLGWFCNFSPANVPNGTGGTRSYTSVNSSTCRLQAPQNYCSNVVSGLRRIVGSGQNVTTIHGFGLTGNSRLNALRYVARNFVTRILEEGDPGSRIGIVRWADTVVQSRPLTNNTSLIRADLTNMTANGGTNPYLAMSQAAAYGSSFATNHIKAVVLLTDGKPTQLGDVDYSKRNGPFEDPFRCDGEKFCPSSANQTLPICTQLKNNGVQIYTVGFLNPNDREFQIEPGSYDRAVEFLRSCASVDGEGNPRFYTAQDGAQLDEAFSQILTSLGRIRISQ